MPPRDDQRHDKAYALFVSLGAKRTLKRAAEQMGLSVSTIKAWARHENWKKRLAEQESQQARQVIDRNLHDGAQETSRNIKLVQMALLALAKNIREGKVTGVMSDIDRLIRLEEYLNAKNTPKGRDVTVVIPEDWTPENTKKFLADAAIHTYRSQPEDRERIRTAIADIDAGRDATPPRPGSAGAFLPPARPVKGTVFLTEGSEMDSPGPGPPNTT